MVLNLVGITDGFCICFTYVKIFYLYSFLVWMLTTSDGGIMQYNINEPIRIETFIDTNELSVIKRSQMSIGGISLI